MNAMFIVKLDFNCNQPNNFSYGVVPGVKFESISRQGPLVRLLHKIGVAETVVVKSIAETCHNRNLHFLVRGERGLLGQRLDEVEF